MDDQCFISTCVHAKESRKRRASAIQECFVCFRAETIAVCKDVSSLVERLLRDHHLANRRDRGGSSLSPLDDNLKIHHIACFLAKERQTGKKSNKR